jgi:exodeoxyribonuclease VII small subunit
MTNTNPLGGFEQTVQELQAIVKQLEGGEVSLEQSLEAFEKGVRLTRECQETLKKAEQKVEQLMAVESGNVRTSPLK